MNIYTSASLNAQIQNSVYFFKLDISSLPERVAMVVSDTKLCKDFRVSYYINVPTTDILTSNFLFFLFFFSYFFANSHSYFFVFNTIYLVPSCLSIINATFVSTFLHFNAKHSSYMKMLGMHVRRQEK